jgi:hypothetical protein
MRSISISIVALLLATSGCVLDPDADRTAAAGDAVTETAAASAVNGPTAARPKPAFCETGECGFWDCFPSYTLCQDGTCQGIGGTCTVDTEQTDCAYEACHFVRQCCPQI